MCNIVIGPRTEEQLKQNLAANGWTMSADQVARLDAASQETLIYPSWHQKGFDERKSQTNSLVRWRMSSGGGSGRL